MLVTNLLKKNRINLLYVNNSPYTSPNTSPASSQGEDGSPPPLENIPDPLDFNLDSPFYGFILQEMQQEACAKQAAEAQAAEEERRRAEAQAAEEERRRAEADEKERLIARALVISKNKRPNAEVQQQSEVQQRSLPLKKRKTQKELIGGKRKTKRRKSKRTKRRLKRRSNRKRRRSSKR
jgi:hypothetical protein